MRYREWRILSMLLAAAGLAAWLTFAGPALAQTQPMMTSAYVKAGLPVSDPGNSLWQSATPLEVPLTPQAGILPGLLTVSIPTMRVRSLNDGAWIAFRLEWDDATRDEMAVAPDQFRDAAAIQLPVDQSRPGVCMGVRGQPVNLWHWKADWQRDIDSGFQDITSRYPNFWKDYYPFAVGNPPFKAPTDFASPDARQYTVGWSAGNPLSDPARVTPVEELVAHGFGTATHADEQGVLGKGVWENGKWAVVFARPLTTAVPAQAQLSQGAKGYLAVAAWNGSNQEVGSRKQISTDFAFTVEPAPSSGGTSPVAQGPITRVVQVTQAQGPSNWWLITTVGVAVTVTAFFTGAAGVFYLWYRSERSGRTG